LLSVFVHTLSSADLYVLGIRPRDWSSLSGVFTSPLVHYGFGHLFANLAPLIVLALLILLEGQRRFWWVTGLVLVLGGLVLWLLGPSNGVYFGASSLVFGYLGYVIVRALVVRDPIWIVAGFAVAIVYAGVVASLFTVSPHVSWIGHIASLLSGIFVAFKFPATQPRLTGKAVRKRTKPAAPALPRTRKNTGHGLD
jgi:membrane associated rhomboid family serine protease